MGLFSTPRATMATMGGLGLVLLLVVLSWARSPYGARWWDGLGGPRRGFGVVGPHPEPPVVRRGADLEDGAALLEAVDEGQEVLPV